LKNTRLGAFSQLIGSSNYSDPSGSISIGENFGIREFSFIGGAGGVRIVNDCIIGQYLSIHPENHNFADPDMLIRHQGVSRKGVIIGNNCWIGVKVTILDGSVIGDNCVVAAGSLVRGKFPDSSIIGGVPARVLRKVC